MNPGAGLGVPDARGAAALRDARRRRQRRHPRRARLLDARLDRSDAAGRAQRDGRRRRGRHPRQQLPRGARQDAERVSSPMRSRCRRRCQTPETFGALPIRTNGDQVVRLRDVADVELGPEEHRHRRSASTARRAPSSASRRRPSANPLTVAARGDEGDRRDPADPAAGHDGARSSTTPRTSSRPRSRRCSRPSARRRSSSSW